MDFTIFNRDADIFGRVSDRVENAYLLADLNFDIIKLGKGIEAKASVSINPLPENP